MWISLPDKNMKYSWKQYGGVAHIAAIAALPALEPEEKAPVKRKASAKKAPVKRKSSAKKAPVKRKSSAKKAPVKRKSSAKKLSAAQKKAAGYTKRKGQGGQTLYYKKGKRIAKKNIPAKYQ